eukprot:CAMPEP_0172537350 /NCGR_PEP_ID=MMETSP1067-20121228/8967_1 /TAXON_ID=265564 ORGANISM="Thalassiosira punctigera, Strain Tpunct2005C2" /NCGR_SAMPLE_ID=MMETSP1067 /ASSEMBLY_ACC=CAM_ASM_000444 /LENGTH=253 /DNA_ID=CAMNT_0013322637 /DNA_START=456 /DNA_END=1217 /DNA_ORIENTATION=-
MSEMPDDPVYSGPNGEMVPVPYFEEKMKSSMGMFWCCIRGYMRKFLSVRGLPQGVKPLPSYERDELLRRLAGNWKIQLLPGNTSTMRMISYEDIFISGDEMVMSGGTHNASSGTGEHRHRAARANEPQESRIVPFRGRDGTLYLDQLGSKVVRESPDGGEIELDNAMGFKMLWQREWKRQGHVPPVPAPSAPLLGNSDEFVTTAYPVSTATSIPSGGDRDIAKEIMQLKQLHDQGVLSDQEFSEGKARLLSQL